MSDTGKTIALIKALAPKLDPEDVKQSVEDWLDDHPEATTTVQDGAITKAKLDSNLKGTVDDVGDLKSALKFVSDIIGITDYGLLGGYAFTKSSGNTTVTVTDTETGVTLTKTDTVNATCRFKPTSWKKGKYTVSGTFSSASVSPLTVYENGSLADEITVTNKVFSFEYTWDGEKSVQFGFLFPYNVSTLQFTMNIFNALTVEEQIEELGNPPPYIIGETNTFFGEDAGKNTSETQVNEADDGKFNTAFGTEAMKANTSGDHCSAFGYKSLSKNTTGDANTGFGQDTLYENTTGEYNTAVGSHALQNNNANGNTAVGSNAGRNVSSGVGNTIIGNQAGSAVQTGSNNIMIGSYVAYTGNDHSDTIVIGNQIIPSADHQIKIGGENITSFVIRMNGINMQISFNQDGSVTWSELT